MIDNHFRKFLPRFTAPLLSFYKLLRITPNQLSILSLVLSVVAAYLVARGSFIEALALWWCGRLLDGTDGIYARSINQATSFGAFLDIVCDMASYSLMIIGFYYAFPSLAPTWLAILFLYVLCITGALSLGSFENKAGLPTKDNRGLRLAAGVAEGGETGIAYSLFLLFPNYIGELSKIWIAVLVLTILARTILAKREL